MTNAELLAKIKAEIERQIKNYRDDGFGCHANSLEKLLSFLSTLESEKPNDLVVKWLVDGDYDEQFEKGLFILGSVGIGYNGYYIPYSDLLKLPKEDEK